MAAANQTVAAAIQRVAAANQRDAFMVQLGCMYAKEWDLIYLNCKLTYGKMSNGKSPHMLTCAAPVPRPIEHKSCCTATWQRIKMQQLAAHY